MADEEEYLEPEDTQASPYAGLSDAEIDEIEAEDSYSWDGEIEGEETMSDEMHFPKSIPGDEHPEPEALSELGEDEEVQTRRRGQGYRSDPYSTEPEDLPMEFPKSLGPEDHRRSAVEAETDFVEEPRQDVPASTIKHKLTGQPMAEPTSGQVTLRHKLEADPFGGHFEDLDFRGQDLRKIQTEGEFKGSLFDKANCSGMTIRSIGVDRGDLRNTTWAGANLTGAEIINMDLRGLDLSEVANAQHLRLVGCDLRGAKLPKGEKATGLRLEGCTTD